MSDFRATLPEFRSDPLALGAIVVVLSLAWAYVVYMAWGMENLDLAADWWLMPSIDGWDSADLALVFAMWAIMMVAMMLPSAAPLLLRAAQANAQRYGRAHTLLATGAMVLGFALIWTAFAALATLAQWSLLEARLMSPMMASASLYLSALLLAAAGAYQFTPFKDACLALCRSPVGALRAERRGSLSAALLLGLDHGAYCLGCCWLLMTLLFVLGVMNLLWIVTLTLLVLLEQTLYQPRWLVRIGGIALLVWAALVAVRAAYLLH